MNEVPDVADAQRLTSIRSIIERLAEQLNRPEPDLDLARTLADVALDGLRKLEQGSGPFLEEAGS
jgi:hypothetical protein